MKTKIVLFLIGLVIIAAAAGLIGLLAVILQKGATTSGALGIVTIVLMLAILIGVLWLAGKGWDTTNPYIMRYKGAYLMIIAWIPILNFLIPYWVGLGAVRLLGLDASIELDTAGGRVRGGQRDPLEMILEAMVSNTSDSLKAGEYQAAIDSATSNIQLCEDQARDKPNLSAVFNRHMVTLYNLRAQARSTLGQQSGSAELGNLARQDSEMAQRLQQSA